MIIDIFNHIIPSRFFEQMTEVAPALGDIVKRMQNVRPLHDLDIRFKAMDGVDDYRQIISLPNPPIEAITTPETGVKLARLGNDGMAELVERHRDRFPAFVAALPMHDMEAAMAELHRAIKDLGARGVQVYTNVAGRPLDDPEFEPVFAAMADYDLPIWLHPARAADLTDYAAERRSRYEMWWVFGWPYETSVAMTRMVLSGLFDRYPGLKIITHHLGGMIPYHEGRVDGGLAVLGARTSDEDYSKVLSSLKRSHIEYFKMFYGDTALFGPLSGTKCGLDFFGVDNVVFATDAPFAPIRRILDGIGELGLGEEEHKRVCQGNAERLMKMSFD
jgi:aminocarboxymuconate-semialdehyde decarboxylase